MTGALIQLVAIGQQDVSLTGNPEITFFKSVYKTHTNFAIDSTLQVINGNWGQGQTVYCTISRSGDLVGPMTLILGDLNQGGITITDGYACDRTIEHCISQIDLIIGGQVIDSIDGHWLRIRSELMMNEKEKLKYCQLTSSTDQFSANTLRLPLPFCFNRNPGLFIPLIALQYHEIQLAITFTQSALIDWDNSTGLPYSSLWVDYVFLDTEERRQFAQNEQTYLIEQTQRQFETVSTISSTEANQTISINFKHPVKEIYWIFGNNVGEYSIYPERPNFISRNFIQGTNYIINNVTNQTIPGALMNTGNLDGDQLILLSASNFYGFLENPLSTAKIVFGSQDRTPLRTFQYFNEQQPYYYHSGKPQVGIYSYSFALHPEDYQPTGTCNFSRLNNPQFQFNVTPYAATRPVSMSTNIRLYALNYNVLKISSGYGTLQYV